MASENQTRKDAKNLVAQQDDAASKDAGRLEPGRELNDAELAAVAGGGTGWNISGNKKV